jgi:integrase
VTVSGIRKRGDRWLVTVEAGLDERGVRRRICRTVATEDEAKRTLAKLRNEVYSGEWLDPTTITLGEFFGRWLPYKQGSVVPATFARYQSIASLHFALIARMRLAKISEATIIHLEASEIAAGLSPATVRKHHWLLRQALGDAVAWRLISRNPAANLHPVAEQRSEIHVVAPADQLRLLSAAGGTRMYLPIVLDLGTGLRRGEMLGLQWGDVDLGRGKLAVQRALRFGADGRPEFGPCKTARSRRVLSLPNSLTALLLDHRSRQANERAMSGSAWQGDLIFCGIYGAPWRLDSFATAFRRLRERAAAAAGADASKEALELGATEEQAEQAAKAAAAPLLACRFHDLRHTHATELMRAGIHVKVVSERLGHSSVRVTLDRYSHVLPDMQDEAAAAADVLLAPLLCR